MRAFVSCPFSHSMSTVNPPRAFNPVIFPEGYADGRAGSN
jgi:hypothetical protein